eukprot:1156369-Pelagomonas_calceolata.AAC.2
MQVTAKIGQAQNARIQLQWTVACTGICGRSDFNGRWHAPAYAAHLTSMDGGMHWHATGA